MRAAVCRGFGEALSIEEIELDRPRDGEVKVAVRACAICHSDIAFADGAWGGALPAVYGHEAAGTIRAVGPGVRGLSTGQPVVVTLVRACGQCHCCTGGNGGCCEGDFPRHPASPLSTPDGHSVTHGLKTGAFAEEVVVHASQVVAIDDALSLPTASLLACGVITGVGAVINTAQVRPGDNVVVIGTGGVGLNSVQGARIAGARHIIAVDVAEVKLQAARRFGATETLFATDPDLAEQVRAATGGRGADYVFVTVGAAAAFATAYGLLAPGGALVVVGMPPSGVTSSFDPGDLAGNGQRILGSKMGGGSIHRDIPALIALYRQDRLLLDELISGRFALDDINQAIADVKRGSALRNVIVFD